MIRDVYVSDEGIKELVRLCNDAKLFEPIATQEDLYLHNYLVRQLADVGFCKANTEKIVKSVINLPKPKETKEQIVEKAYFGKDPDIE